ncbi:hypothetical protein ACOSP7_015292 [Xanthoceras sorbifolium]
MSNSNFSNFPIEQVFDLDEALTMMPNAVILANMPKDSGHQITDTTLSSLPTVATVGVCTVCMEDFQSGFRGKQVPCGHLYHESCIATWISLNNSCPLCRSQCIISGQE